MLELLAVVPGLLLDLLHLGLQLFHARHRDVGFIRKRQKQRLDQERQADDGPAHVADQAIQPMEDSEDGLCEEEEPAPVDRVDELVDPVVTLIGADRLPLLGAGEQALVDRNRLARRNLLGVQKRGGLKDVAARVVLQGGLERLFRGGDKRRHPVVVSEANPTVARDLGHICGGAPAFDRIHVFKVVVVELVQLFAQSAEWPLRG